MSFWGELRRRNVVKVGVAYLVVAWLLAQVVDLVLPTFNAPEWVAQTVIFLLILGLPIILIVAWAFEITPAGLKLTSSVPRAESITPVTGQRLNYFVTALLAFAVVFLVADNYVLDGAVDDSASEITARESEVASAASDETGVLPNSVAVIPFSNLSPDEEDAYFAAGIHEEILNQLVKLSNLNVIARTSVMQYADTQMTIPEIANELGVETVMEGSVRYADGQVLVTTQLIDAETNVHLWSDSYQRDFSNIFAIQADIAMNVANALRAEYSLEEQASIEAPPTESIEAYDHYLLAQSLVRQGLGLGIGFPETRRLAIAEYQRALELDADFELAILGLAQLANDFQVDNPVINAARNRAIELAPQFPAALGLVMRDQVNNLQWTAAEDSLRNWLARAPDNDYQANLAYGMFLKNLGRARESLPYLELARRKDPMLAGPSIHLTMAYDALGDFDRADELHSRMVNLVGYDFTAAAPQFWRVLPREGVDVAVGVFLRAFDYTEEEFRGVITTGLASNPLSILLENRGSPEVGLAELRTLYDAEIPDEALSAVMLNVGLVASYYGDIDLSLSAFRRLRGQGLDNLLQFAWIPLMAPMRSHPDFKAVLREFGLPEYWREYGWPEHCRPVGADDFACS